MAVGKVIVATHDWLYPLYGGGGPRTVKVAQEFRKRGYDVIFFGPSKRDEIDGIPVYNLPPPTKKLSQVLSTVKFNIGILFYFLKVGRDADMIFIHSTIAAGVFLFISKFFKKKFILDICDIIAGYLWVSNVSIIQKIIRQFLLAVEYKIIKSADVLIVVTDAMKKHCIEKGVKPEKITIIYDGVELDNSVVEKSSDAYYNLIHLGIVDKQHGVSLFMRAAPIISREFPKVRFFIVGDGRELPIVKRMAQDLGVYHRCVFTGFVEYPKAKEILKQVNIGVIPRPNILVNNLVITLKLLEYWSTGTAVVASRLQGISEIAADGENILFFKPDDHVDLSSKIIYLLKNPNRLAELQKNGRNLVKCFDWQKIIPRIVDVSINNRIR